MLSGAMGDVNHLLTVDKQLYQIFQKPKNAHFQTANQLDSRVKMGIASDSDLLSWQFKHLLS